MLHATIQWGTTVVCVTQDSPEMDTTVQVCSSGRGIGIMGCSNRGFDGFMYACQYEIWIGD